MRRPKLNLPAAVTDRLPDAISDRLPGTTNNRLITGKRLAIGGGLFTLVAAVVAAGASAVRNRYQTGEAKVVQTLLLEEGGLVVLDNDVAFWASAETLRVINTYTGDGDGTSPLPYKIDRFRRHLKSGLAVGSVNTDTDD